MTETDYQKLLKGFITVSDMLSLMYNIPSDMDYPKALNIYAKQQQILSNEETKKFNEKIQTEKFKEDLKLRKAELKLSKDKQHFYETIELMKLDIEKSRLEMDKSRLEMDKSRLEIDKTNQKILLENGRKERKIRYISLIITSVTSVAGIIIPAVLFYKMGILDMKHKYRDEGITSKFYESSMKNIANLM